MKNHPSVKTLLDTKHAVNSVPELIAEWNMNRYTGAVPENFPLETDEGYDIELFPIESIVENNRPGKGINKARIGQSAISDDYLSTSSNSFNGRYYLADVDDTYKYWTSPYLSDNAGNITGCQPVVIYNSAVAVNKIVIQTENTWASAKNFSIQTTDKANPGTSPTSSDWTTIVTQAGVGSAWKASGRITLWYNGTGWVTTGRSDNTDKTPKTKSIRGIRMIVTSLEKGYKTTYDGSLQDSTYVVQDGFTTKTTDGFNSHFDLIEMGARLEVDLSQYVISTSKSFDIGEASALYPIGTNTTNQGTVQLSNIYKNSSGVWVPGLFYTDNADSPYKGLIEPNVEMTLSYVYKDEAGSVIDKVKDFCLYVDSWKGQDQDSVTVELSDYSKFFNTSEATLRASLWEGLKFSEIVYRILDSIGFTKYRVEVNDDLQTDEVIDIFYTDGEKNAWEVLEELSMASQSAIYFDADGWLQIKTRRFAMSPDNAATQTFNANKAGSVLPNIVDLSVDSEFEPNYYKIAYKKTNWSPDVRGVSVQQSVWNPESDVVLRATQLTRTLSLGDQYLWMGSDDVKLWPYEGIVNVQGELIRYNGKVFTYYTGANGTTANTLIIDSDSDYSSRNSKTPVQYRHKNHFTGKLLITERGVWNSEEKRHPVEAEGYSTRQVIKGVRKTDVGGFVHNKQESRVMLRTNNNFSTGGDFKVATRGNENDTTFFHYGTRFRFIKQDALNQQIAGLVINNNSSNEDGYYFALTPSSKGSAGHKEFLMWTRRNGSNKILGTRSFAVGENIDYELDLTYAVEGTSHRLQAWINGKNVMNVNVSGNDKNTAGGKFGVFVAGKSMAEYEYLYAIRREEESEMLEDFSFLDKVERGYMGGQWDREWVYKNRSQVSRKKKKSNKNRKRWNRQFFDEFGPIIHEVREFDVNFDPAPVAHSRLYMTNDWAGCAVEYMATPFGAKFIIANTSRRNAVLNGEDTLSFSGTGDSIDQVLTVFGKALVIDEDEEVVAKNDEQIRKRLKIESEISSPWIQSKSMAKEIAEWLNNNFSYGNENITFEVFGNPLVELTDVVKVKYADKFIDGDYFITGINSGFEDGLVTTLTARRRKV